MGRKPTTSNDLPENLTFDPDRNRYRYRNPETGVRTTLGGDRAQAIETATKANHVLRLRRQTGDAARGAPVTLSHVVDMYSENVAPRKGWDAGTRDNNRFRLGVIKRELGHRTIATTDRVFLADWLDARATTGELHNKWRTLLVDLWVYALSRRWVDINEPAATMKRSTSKKIVANRRRRPRLELSQFWAIHDHSECPLFLQIAMAQSLITLQSRKEICNMRLADYRDGWLFVIRDKVAGDSEMAFIRIKITPQLEDILARSKDGLHSPYLVHYSPISRRRKHMEAKPHWTYVMPGFLSKAFAEVRDKTGLFTAPGGERPTFHEIRSLGARIYRDADYSKGYIQGLMTHADAKTTKIYLEGGKLTDDHYHKVAAELNLNSLRN